MTGLEKYLRSDETIARSGGVSYVSLLARALLLAVVILGYWLVTRFLIQIGADSPFSDVMRPIQEIVFRLCTAFLVLYAFVQFAGLCIRAAFWRYGLTGSRVLKKSFLRMRAADLTHVQDVEVIQNLLGKLLGYGNVVIRTASTDGTIVLRSVDKPYEWFREIHEAVRTAQLR